MDVEPGDWLPDSPGRSPAWRWLRALRRHDRGAPPDRHFDDAWVGRACTCLARPGGARGRAAAAARALWEGAGRGRAGGAGGGPAAAAGGGGGGAGGARRGRLEAGLLPPEPLARVAAAAGVPRAVADAYHALFFCVRPRLAARDWVLARAV